MSQLNGFHTGANPSCCTYPEYSLPFNGMNLKPVSENLCHARTGISGSFREKKGWKETVSTQAPSCLVSHWTPHPSSAMNEVSAGSVYSGSHSCAVAPCFTALSNRMIPTQERNWVPFYVLLPQKGHFLLSTAHSWQQRLHKSCQLLFVDLLSNKKSERLWPAWSKQVNGLLSHVWRGRAAGIRRAAKPLQTQSSSWWLR